MALMGFFIRPLIGALVLAAGLLFCAVHIYFAHKRYREMEELAQKLNRILHGQDKVLIEESVEGELSILNSELHKMTRRLKEQADQLAAEKLQLTEAIQDIFHQIRTPLTSMNLIVSMLREENLPYERRLIGFEVFGRRSFVFLLCLALKMLFQSCQTATSLFYFKTLLWVLTQAPPEL